MGGAARCRDDRLRDRPFVERGGTASGNDLERRSISRVFERIADRPGAAGAVEEIASRGRVESLGPAPSQQKVEPLGDGETALGKRDGALEKPRPWQLAVAPMGGFEELHEPWCADAQSRVDGDIEVEGNALFEESIWLSRGRGRLPPVVG